MLGSAWWKTRYPRVATIYVKDGRGRSRACASPANKYIKMPKWSRHEIFVLHEVAHIVQPLNTAWHGREFAQTFLDLVQRFMGKSECDALKKCFREGHVKWLPKRESTGKPRPGAAEHLRVWREKQAALKTQPIPDIFEDLP